MACFNMPYSWFEKNRDFQVILATLPDLVIVFVGSQACQLLLRVKYHNNTHAFAPTHPRTHTHTRTHKHTQTHTRMHARIDLWWA